MIAVECSMFWRNCRVAPGEAGCGRFPSKRCHPRPWINSTVWREPSLVVMVRTGPASEGFGSAFGAWCDGLSS